MTEKNVGLMQDIKENEIEVGLTKDVKDSEVKDVKDSEVKDLKSKDFNSKLDIIKEKVVRFKDLEKEYSELHREVRDLASDFIKKYKCNKQQLGKIVSWIDDVYIKDELVSILTKSNINSFGEKNSLDTNLAKIPVRLDHALARPEAYSDERVNSIVKILNTYDNYIDTFESIELTDYDNCLDKHRYLISAELHNLLMNGYKLKRDRTINKSERGVYITVFKLIKSKDKEFLMYKYIKYPYIFYDCLFNYFVRESNSLVVRDGNSVGTDHLFVIDNLLLSKEYIEATLKRISERFELDGIHRESRGIYPRNIIDLFKILLKGCPILLSEDKITLFIELALKRRIFDIMSGVVNLYNFYDDISEKSLKVLEESISKLNYENYNFLSRVVFVTDDLDKLIKNLQVSSGVNVNQGPKPWRGQSDSLSNRISSIDNDFRKSMNRHNQYHVNMGNIPRNSLIGRSKFSYQNIHLNLGNVRWYSSKTYSRPVSNVYKEAFYDISEYLKNYPINKDTQLKIENSLYDSSYISLVEKISNSDKPVINYKLINKRFSELLIKDKPKLLDYINRYRDTSFEKEPTKTNDLIFYLLSLVLKELEDDFIVSVINGRLFKIVSSYQISNDRNKAVNIFIDIGTDLVQNYMYSLYRKEQRTKERGLFTLSDWKSENTYIVEKFDNSTVAELGGKIVNILKNIDLIKIQLITTGVREKQNILIPTERVLETLDKENQIKPLPRRLPMIVKPKNYSRTTKLDGSVRELLGGYLLNDVKYTDPLMIPKWNFSKPTLIKNENLVYDLVNNINSVGFKINKDVLEFINVYGSRYNLVIPSNFIHSLSLKNKLTKAESVELSSFLSKKDLQENILGVAEIFSHVHEFFLPTRLDFRGRLYCVSEFLTYQSTELAKALLLFSNSEKLSKSDKTSIDYLKAYGANCFGNKLEKMSWKARCKWVDDNKENIINFRDGVLIEKAEKKLLFIAFCFEYNRFLECIDNGKDYFETNLPIQLDATCNGYQHLALLSLDFDLAKQLNLTNSTEDSEPKDFYGFTAVKLINYFRNKLSYNNLSEEEREIYTRFSNLTIARKIVKKVIMTIPYNVTNFAIIDYLKENFDLVDTSIKDNAKFSYKDDSSVIFMEKDFPILAKGLKTVLFEDNFKLKKLLTYLNGVVGVVVALNLPIHWGTPDTGVNIEQSYVDSKEERLKVFSYTKKTFKVKVADKSTNNRRKQKIAFLPNFIHSLDAASLALLVNYYFNDNNNYTKNIYTIHDCFAVTANNVKNLIFLLSHVYQKVYTEKNYLREFDQKMIEFIEYSCKKDISFDKDSKIIITKQGNMLQYPSVDVVLGETCNTDGLIKESSYLIH